MTTEPEDGCTKGMNMVDDVEVSDADVAVAEAIVSGARGFAVRFGEPTKHSASIAVARHRLASTEALRAELAEQAKQYVALVGQQQQALEELAEANRLCDMRAEAIEKAWNDIAAKGQALAEAKAEIARLVEALRKINNETDDGFPPDDGMTIEQRIAWLEAEWEEEPTRLPWGGDGRPPCRNGHEIAAMQVEYAGLVTRNALAKLSEPRT